MPDFIKGLELNELFYNEAVAPLFESHFPQIAYSAALIGWGSEVLGFDDSQSADHNWGIRFQIFLPERDAEKYRRSISRVLDEHLPTEFRGHPVAFPVAVNEDQRGNAVSAKNNIEIETVREFFTRFLGCDPSGGISAADWLTFPEHKLLGVTGGRVFDDGSGELEAARRKFSYYPKDVWLYMLAAQWMKIFEQQAFVGRCGYAGDEIGSMIIAARQVKNLMRLCFLLERRYAPYGKWFGTAFSRLDCATELGPVFSRVLRAEEWKERQECLARAYEIAARMHNALKLTIPMQEKAARYFERPYLVAGDERYPEELRKNLTDEKVKNIEHRLGSVNQFVDSESLLDNVSLLERLKDLYE